MLGVPTLNPEAPNLILHSPYEILKSVLILRLFRTGLFIDEKDSF